MVWLGMASWAMACARPDAAPVKQQGQPASPKVSARDLTARDVADARVALERIYATHFAEGQGDWEPHRRAWFTARLAKLIQDDSAAGAAQCGVGFLNFDPFTSAQDSVAGYTLGSPKALADTVLVPVRIHANLANDSDRNSTVAMVRDGGSWRVGNMMHSNGELVSDLTRSVAELRAAPKVDCSAPPAAPSDSAHGNSTGRGGE